MAASEAELKAQGLAASGFEALPAEPALTIWRLLPPPPPLSRRRASSTLEQEEPGSADDGGQTALEDGEEELAALLHGGFVHSSLRHVLPLPTAAEAQRKTRRQRLFRKEPAEHDAALEACGRNAAQLAAHLVKCVHPPQPKETGGAKEGTHGGTTAARSARQQCIHDLDQLHLACPEVGVSGRLAEVLESAVCDGEARAACGDVVSALGFVGDGVAQVALTRAVRDTKFGDFPRSMFPVLAAMVRPAPELLESLAGRTAEAASARWRGRQRVFDDAASQSVAVQLAAASVASAASAASGNESMTAARAAAAIAHITLDLLRNASVAEDQRWSRSHGIAEAAVEELWQSMHAHEREAWAAHGAGLPHTGLAVAVRRGELPWLEAHAKARLKEEWRLRPVKRALRPWALSWAAEWPADICPTQGSKSPPHLSSTQADSPPRKHARQQQRRGECPP